MKTLFTPMRLFSAATVTPLMLLTLAAIYGGVWTLAVLLYLTVFTFAADTMVKTVTPPTSASEFPVADALSVVLAIGHFVVLGLVVLRLGDGRFYDAGNVGLFLAAGFFFGQISNSNAHELIHRGGRNMHRLGKWIYISLMFGHHTSAHVLVHHRHVATAQDPSSARLGETYYHFLVRAWRGSFRKGLQAETERQRRIGAPLYAHPYVHYVLGAIGFVALAYGFTGLQGAICYVALASFSTSQLLLSDYVQHYGLQRKIINDKPEPVGPRHSWNSPHWLSSAVMLNAPRHSDHHAHPSRIYPTLALLDEGPMLPRSLPVMGCLALLPRRWRRVMDPLARDVAARQIQS